MTNDVNPREIRAMLQKRLDQVLGTLFKGYQITSPVFAPLNPTRPDKTPGSFVIWTAGAAAGGFNEYSPKGPPASGDVIDLIAYVEGHARDRRYALARAREILGLKQLDAAALKRAKVEAKNFVAQTDAQQTDAAKQKMLKANEIWNRAGPIAGSVGEIYLASRRIPLVLVKNAENNLRFIQNLEHWKSVKWDTKTKPWTRLNEGYRGPAMIAAFRNFAGDITAVHCTFLRADGSGKAPVDEAKLMRGVAKGSAIWLTRGEGDLPLQEAMKSGEFGPCILSEGIENGLSAALAAPEARVAACGSFDLMLALDVAGVEIFDPVVYALDNDNNAKADDAINDHLDMLHDAGRSARVMRPDRAFKDFNDVLQGKEREADDKEK